MNRLIGNRDKRIAILLIAAFAWLFIGSLIIFHEEHVLGKHFGLTSQLFISPKSSDKKGHTLNLQKSILKITDNVLSPGVLPHDDYSGLNRIPSELESKETSSFLPGDAYLKNASLRAPPVI